MVRGWSKATLVILVRYVRTFSVAAPGEGEGNGVGERARTDKTRESTWRRDKLIDQTCQTWRPNIYFSFVRDARGHSHPRTMNFVSFTAEVCVPQSFQTLYSPFDWLICRLVVKFASLTWTHRHTLTDPISQVTNTNNIHYTICIWPSWRAICNSSGCGVYRAKTKPTERSAEKIGANPAKTQYHCMLSLTVLVLVLVAHTLTILRSNKYMQSKRCHVLLSFHRDQHSFECAISGNFSYMHRAYSQLTTHQLPITALARAPASSQSTAGECAAHDKMQ